MIEQPETMNDIERADVAHIKGLCVRDTRIDPRMTSLQLGDVLGVSPSNRGDNHTTSYCAPTRSVVALGDGRVGVQPVPELDDGSRLGIRHTGDTA